MKTAITILGKTHCEFQLQKTLGIIQKIPFKNEVNEKTGVGVG